MTRWTSVDHPDCICREGSLWKSHLSCSIKVLWQKLARKRITMADASSDPPSEESDPQRSRIERSNPLWQVSPGVFIQETDFLYRNTLPFWRNETVVSTESMGEGLVTHAHDGLLTYADTKHNTFIIYDRENKPVVTINLNTAEVKVRDGLLLSSISRDFWNMMESMGQSRMEGYADTIITLTKGIENRNDVISRQLKEIEYLKMVGTTYPEDCDERFVAVGEEL